MIFVDEEEQIGGGREDKRRGLSSHERTSNFIGRY